MFVTDSIWSVTTQLLLCRSSLEKWLIHHDLKMVLWLNALGPRLRPQYLSTYWIAKHHHRWYLWLKNQRLSGHENFQVRVDMHGHHSMKMLSELPWGYKEDFRFQGCQFWHLSWALHSLVKSMHVCCAMKILFIVLSTLEKLFKTI